MMWGESGLSAAPRGRQSERLRLTKDVAEVATRGVFLREVDEARVFPCFEAADDVWTAELPRELDFPLYLWPKRKAF